MDGLILALLKGKAKMAGSAPASADADGVKGSIAFDDDYLYICTDTDTWKRVAIETW